MTRLCERPGCSAPASVAYGFAAASTIVWLAALDENEPARELAGALCRRHADSLTPPRGWWLDDRRVARPRLFTMTGTELDADPDDHGAPSPTSGTGPTVRPEDATTSVARPSPKRKRKSTDDTDELALAFIGDDGSEGDVHLDQVEPGAGRQAAVAPTPAPTEEPEADGPTSAAFTVDSDETRALPWTPVFDRADDLGGVLAARSPLLSRAFGVRLPPA